MARAAATPTGLPLKVPEAGTPQSITSDKPTTAPKGHPAGDGLGEGGDVRRHPVVGLGPSPEPGGSR